VALDFLIPPIKSSLYMLHTALIDFPYRPRTQICARSVMKMPYEIFNSHQACLFYDTHISFSTHSQSFSNSAIIYS
jgi:hypothetical protein